MAYIVAYPIIGSVMLCKRVTAWFGPLALLWTVPAHAQLSDAWDEKYQGISHLVRQGTDTEGVQQSYHLAVVDLTHPSVRVQVANNSDTWKGSKERTSSMALRHGAVLAVNGDYWSWGSNDPSQGSTVIDGFCYRAHPVSG